MTATIDSNVRSAKAAPVPTPSGSRTRRAPRRCLTGGARIAAQIGVIVATVAVAGVSGILAG